MQDANNHGQYDDAGPRIGWWLGLILAGAALALAWLVGHHIFFELPVSTDEGSYVFQAYTFSDGKVSRPHPPMASVLSRSDDMIIMDKQAGWVSRYPPGHALWLLPGALLDNPRIMTVSACALGVLLMTVLAAKLGIPRLAVPFLLLVSPFYLLMYGTLLSHTSGFISVAVMLWAYIRLRQTGKWIYGAVAGIAWGLLYLNRTFTAALIALPFAVDALICLARNRDKKAFVQTVAFGACAIVGVAMFFGYNYLVTGDAGTPTYLFYEPSETLGFGPRHLQGLLVNHDLTKGLSNTWRNLLELDRWLVGIRFGLPVLIVLIILGWSARWSLLLVSAALMLIGGYVFVWFPGPKHTGPAYYFESLPFLILAAALGIKRIHHWTGKWRAARAIGWTVAACAVIAGSGVFVMNQKAYFNDVLALEDRMMKSLSTAPKGSLVFLEDLTYPPFGKITVNEKGLDSDPLVVMSQYGYNSRIHKQFPDRTPFLLKGGNEDELIPLNFDGPGDICRIRLDVDRMAKHTGENERLSQTHDNWVRVAREGRDSPNFMAYGRHHSVPPGDYVVHYKFVKVDGHSERPSRIDVATDIGRTILAKDAMYESVYDSVVSLDFALEYNDFVRVEPRVFFGGAGEVVLKSILIEEQSVRTFRQIRPETQREVSQ